MASRITQTARQSARTVAKSNPGHLTVGPKQAFKHIVLNELLKAMSARYANGWTYIDFTPGPGSYQAYDGGLSALYAHGRKKFDAKERNFFQSYIGSILKFNGETNTRKLKESPEMEKAPSKYFSNAGLAAMYMDNLDKAILIEEDPETLKLLRAHLQEQVAARQVKIIPGSFGASDSIAKAVMPPINRRGLVTFDLDAKLGNVAPAGTFGLGGFATQNYYMGEASEMIGMMVKRWPTATFFFPYSMTSPSPPAGLFKDIAKSGVKQVLNVSMFFEGDPNKSMSASYAGSGIGCVIVNPPANLDHTLHNHMPGLKTEVFQPEILLDDDSKVSAVKVRHMFRTKQPWDDVETSVKLPSWDPQEKTDWSEEQMARRAAAEKEDAEADFMANLDIAEDDGFDDIYEACKFEPEPEKLDPDFARRDWTAHIARQAQMQDARRPTIVRMRKEDNVQANQE